jgi:uncharacterized membrane protein (DUF485 family)
MAQQPPAGGREGEQRKSNIGIRMTILYSLVYGGFVVLSVFRPEIMGRNALFGMNLAISYGLFLILFAVLLAVIYNLLVKEPKNNGNKTESLSSEQEEQS